MFTSTLTTLAYHYLVMFICCVSVYFTDWSKPVLTMISITTMCHWSETDWCQTFQEWSWQQQLQMHLLRKNVPTMKCMERPMGAMGYGWEISWDMVDAGQKRRTTGFGDLLVTETILRAWSHGRNHAGYSMVVAYIWTSTGRLENDQDLSLTAIKFIVCIYRIIVSEECV